MVHFQFQVVLEVVFVCNSGVEQLVCGTPTAGAPVCVCVCIFFYYCGVFVFFSSCSLKKCTCTHKTLFRVIFSFQQKGVEMTDSYSSPLCSPLFSLALFHVLSSCACIFLLVCQKLYLHNYLRNNLRTWIISFS